MHVDAKIKISGTDPNLKICNGAETLAPMPSQTKSA